MNNEIEERIAELAEELDVQVIKHDDSSMDKPYTVRDDRISGGFKTFRAADDVLEYLQNVIDGKDG